MFRSLFPYRGAAIPHRGLPLLFLAVLLGTPVIAEPVWLNRPARLFPLEAPDGPAIADLAIAAELDLTGEAQGSLRSVVLRGWARPGAERVLLAYPGKQVLVARLPKEAVSRLHPIGATPDPDTGIEWTRLETEGWVDADKLAPDLMPLWEEAWALFSLRCTACHQRRIPSNYTANQWRSYLGIMGPRTGLPGDKQAQILVFLQHHARDTVAQEIAAGTAFPPATRR